MKNSIILPFLLLLLLPLLPLAGALAEFSIISRERPAADSVTETVWQADVSPGGEYDRIGLHRYRDPKIPPKAAMLYLPGTNMNGELAVKDPDHNLWLYLARRGVVVYAFDYRTHFVPNEPVPELDFMRAWDLATFVDDAALALRHIKKMEAGLPVFVAGFSRGVTYAYALAGRGDFSGLVVLDGSFKRFEPESFDRDKALAEMEASGEWGSVLSETRGWDNRTEMMRRTYENPEAPAMGKFDSIGAQLTSTLYYAWGPGVLANPMDGVTDITVLARAMEGYDRCFPLIQVVEGRSIAARRDDPATTLDDHFGSMTMPIIYFGAANLGADSLMNGIYSVSRSGSKDVDIHVLENHGHLDVLFGNFVANTVYEEIDAWIDRLVAGEK